MSSATTTEPVPGEHAPGNAITDAGEIERFHDRCSDLVRALLDALADAPGRPRTFPEIEDALGWPRRRIASVLGGVSHLRHTEFGGRRPYRFHDARESASGRWELWMDEAQARAVRRARGVVMLAFGGDGGYVATVCRWAINTETNGAPLG